MCPSHSPRRSWVAVSFTVFPSPSQSCDGNGRCYCWSLLNKKVEVYHTSLQRPTYVCMSIRMYLCSCVSICMYVHVCMRIYTQLWYTCIYIYEAWDGADATLSSRSLARPQQIRNVRVRCLRKSLGRGWVTHRGRVDPMWEFPKIRGTLGFL